MQNQQPKQAPKAAPKPQAPETLEQLEKLAPEAASILKSIVTSSAKEVEHHFNDLSGEKKKELAQQQTEELLKRTYAFADLALNLPPLADLAADFLIPLIPDAIDWAVEMLNKTGIFGKAE